MKNIIDVTARSLFGIAACGIALVALGASEPRSDPACATTHNVEIYHYFEPGDVTIQAGDCVRFENVHGIEHSAVGMEREFNTGVLMPGGTSLIRFDEAGGIPYVCGVHPLMVGVIMVEPREVSELAAIPE